MELLNYNQVHSPYEDGEKRSVCAGCGSYYVVSPEQLARDKEVVNDLYEALELLLWAWESAGGYKDCYCESLGRGLEPCLACRVEIAKKALAKAEGKDE